MLGLLEEVSFNYQFWFVIAFGLGVLQMLTDEFFFGGACIGAFLTAMTLFSVGAENVPDSVNWSLPYVLCGVGGLLGATLMRVACRRHKKETDINEQPYNCDDP